jgi:antitoxin CcdA
MKRNLADRSKPFRQAPAHPAARIGRGTRPGRKRALNITIDEQLLAEARAFGFNLSQVLENALNEKVHDERLRRFREEHRAAFESYNRFIERHGLWGEEYRKW